MDSTRFPQRLASSSRHLHTLPPDLQALAQKLKRAYPSVAPEAQFRQALHARLLTEAQRLQARRAEVPHPSVVRRAIVGAAALSVASLAVVLWRNRLTSLLLSQRQLTVAEGGS